MVVIFQGYDVFSRGNEFWDIASKSWSATLAPWVWLGAFLILLAVGIWISGWKGPHLTRESLFSGAVSRCPKRRPETWTKRKVNRVLDSI
jgi:anti-sigma factor RsiW